MKNRKKNRKIIKKITLPLSLKPLLWSLRWDALNAEKDKEDIIVNVINDGALDQWRWLKRTYGTAAIRRVLSRRLKTEFHPESRNLAAAVFGITSFSHARRSPRSARAKNLSAPHSL